MENVLGRQTPHQTSQPPIPRSPFSLPRSLSSSPRQHSPTPPLVPQSPPPPSDFNQTDSEDGLGQDLPDEDEFPLATEPKIPICLEFVKLVRTATLASQFSPEELADFLNPEEHKSTPPDDPNLRLSLLNLISLMGSSRDTYDAIRQNTQQSFPGIELLSYYQAESCA